MLQGDVKWAEDAKHISPLKVRSGQNFVRLLSESDMAQWKSLTAIVPSKKGKKSAHMV